MHHVNHCGTRNLKLDRFWNIWDSNYSPSSSVMEKFGKRKWNYSFHTKFHLEPGNASPMRRKNKYDRSYKFNIPWWRHLAAKRWSWTRTCTTNLPFSSDIKTVSNFKWLNGNIVRTFLPFKTVTNSQQTQKHREYFVFRWRVQPPFPTIHTWW